MAFINIVLFLFVLFCPLAHARDEGGRAMIFNIGFQSCGEMTEDVVKTTDGEAVLTGYIDGYLTAVNMLSLGKMDFFEGTDSISRYKFVLKYCQDNPLDKVITGINKLVLRYKKTPD